MEDITMSAQRLDNTDVELIERPDRQDRLKQTMSLNSFLREQIDLEGFRVPGVHEALSSHSVQKDLYSSSQSKSGFIGGLGLSAFPLKKRKTPNLYAKESTLAQGESQVLDQQPKEMKRTCGLRLSPSLHLFLIIADVLLVFGLLLGILLPSYLVTEDAIDGLGTASREGLQRSRELSVEALKNMSVFLTFDSVALVRSQLVENSIELATATSLAVRNTILSGREALEAVSPGRSAQYFGQPSALNSTNLTASWKQSVGPFLVRTMGSGLVSSLERTFVGWKTNEFVGTFLNLTALESTGDLVSSLRYSEAPPSDSLSPNETTAKQYAISSENGDPVTLEPVWDQVLSSSTASWRDRPWYAIQRQSAQECPSCICKGGWTDLYEFVNSSAIGLSFSLPISTCGTYECMEGVVGADLEISTMSRFCYERLLSTVIKATTLYQTLQIDSLDEFMNSKAALFVVQNSASSKYTGALFASSHFHISGEEPSILFPRNSQDAIIRYAAKAVETNVPWGDRERWKEYHDTPFFCFFDTDKIDDSVIDCDVTPCFGEACANFVLATALPVNSSFLLGREMSNSLQLVIVLALPADMFLEKLIEEMHVQAAVTNQLMESQTESARDNTIVVVVSAVVFCCITCLLAVWLSLAVSRPLRSLQESMREIREFKFSAPEPQLSRIKEISEIQATFSAVRNTLRVFAKFVPSTVVYNIVSNKPRARGIFVEQRDVTILFSDIAGFTSITEALSQERFLQFITRYLSVMTRVIESYGGVVGEVLGDGILAFWNTPDDVPDHAALACACALAQHESLKEISRNFMADLAKVDGASELSIRIGIHSGRVHTGNIGSEDKLKWGCFGDPVNTASRLEGICKLFGTKIIISEETKNLLPEGVFRLRELSLVRVKGKQNPTRLFEVIRMDSMLDNNLSEMKASLEKSSDASKRTDGLHQRSFCLPCVPFCNKNVSRGSGYLSSSLSGSSGEGGSNSKWKSSAFFSPLGPPASPEFDMDVQAFESALHLFQQGEFQAASETLKLVKFRDTACEFLSTKLDEAITLHGPVAPPEAEWQGIIDLKDKSF